MVIAGYSLGCLERSTLIPSSRTLPSGCQMSRTVTIQIHYTVFYSTLFLYLSYSNIIDPHNGSFDLTSLPVFVFFFNDFCICLHCSFCDHDYWPTRNYHAVCYRFDSCSATTYSAMCKFRRFGVPGCSDHI